MGAMEWKNIYDRKRLHFALWNVYFNPSFKLILNPISFFSFSFHSTLLRIQPSCELFSVYIITKCVGCASYKTHLRNFFHFSNKHRDKQKIRSKSKFDADFWNEMEFHRKEEKKICLRSIRCVVQAQFMPIFYDNLVCIVFLYKFLFPSSSSTLHSYL